MFYYFFINSHPVSFCEKINKVLYYASIEQGFTKSTGNKQIHAARLDSNSFRRFEHKTSGGKT